MNISANIVEKLAKNTFGELTSIKEVQKLTGGLYNEVFKVLMAGDSEFVLRIAPPANEQLNSEHLLLRNEYISIPYFSTIQSLLPITVHADWTHSLIDRDYTWQHVVPGIPAINMIKSFSTEDKYNFYQSIGKILYKIHSITNNTFGMVSHEQYVCWSKYIENWLENICLDIKQMSNQESELNVLKEILNQKHYIFDEVKTPRLLHGDLWTPNVMLDEKSENFRISGILDNDRAIWGDPLADWSFFIAERKNQQAKDAFYSGYKNIKDSTNQDFRKLTYYALHLGTVLIERIKSGLLEKINESKDELTQIINKIIYLSKKLET